MDQSYICKWNIARGEQQTYMHTFVQQNKEYSFVVGGSAKDDIVIENIPAQHCCITLSLHQVTIHSYKGNLTVKHRHLQKENRSSAKKLIAGETYSVGRYVWDKPIQIESQHFIIKVKNTTDHEQLSEAQCQKLRLEYDHVEKMAEGSSCVIYHTPNDRIIKLLKPSYAKYPDVIARFKSVALEWLKRDPAQLKIENFIFDKAHSLYGIVMMFFEGKTLSNYLAQKQRLSFAQVSRIIVSIAEALQRFQDQNLVSRNLVPENIILLPSEVKITGLFLTKTSDQLTSDHRKMDISFYTSPEQDLNPKEVDIMSDVYSLGVIAYEALTGANPFANQNPGQLMDKYKERQMVSMADMKRDLQHIPNDAIINIYKMLSFEKTQRLSPSEIIDAFQNTQNHSSSDVTIFDGNQHTLDASAFAALDRLQQNSEQTYVESTYLNREEQTIDENINPLQKIPSDDKTHLGNIYTQNSQETILESPDVFTAIDNLQNNQEIHNDHTYFEGGDETIAEGKSFSPKIPNDETYLAGTPSYKTPQKTSSNIFFNSNANDLDALDNLQSESQQPSLNLNANALDALDNLQSESQQPSLNLNANALDALDNLQSESQQPSLNLNANALDALDNLQSESQNDISHQNASSYTAQTSLSPGDLSSLRWMNLDNPLQQNMPQNNNAPQKKTALEQSQKNIQSAYNKIQTPKKNTVHKNAKKSSSTANTSFSININYIIIGIIIILSISFGSFFFPTEKVPQNNNSSINKPTYQYNSEVEITALVQDIYKKQGSILYLVIYENATQKQYAVIPPEGFDLSLEITEGSAIELKGIYKRLNRGSVIVGKTSSKDYIKPLSIEILTDSE